MNRRGVTLVEAVVAMGLLSLVAIGLFQFQTQTGKTVRVSMDTAAFTRALSTIERDVMNDMPYLPPQEPAETETLFNDGQKSGTRCYDRTGGRLAECGDFTKNNGAQFEVTFFKVRVPDDTLEEASPLNRIPLSRTHFKVRYKIGGKIDEPFRFSRLTTDVLRF